MKAIDHLWRLFGTALSFVVFGLAGLVIGLVAFPLMSLIVRDLKIRKRLARNTIGHAFGCFIRMMKVLGVIDYRIEGREHIRPRSNMLIVANHPTLIDVVILISLFPNTNCVIKAAVTNNPFMRSVVGAADYIPNSEPETLLDSSVRYLRRGGNLMLFPEGTRTQQGRPIRFKPGAATVALRAGATILPVVIHCEPVFLHKDVPWHYVPPEKPNYLIRILPPVEIAELVSVEGAERHVRTRLNDALQDRILRELARI